MEIELSRLTEELTNREQKLAISSRVANIIRKTIQREQNRIRMLNQGCKASPSAVNSVRLNVNVRKPTRRCLMCCPNSTSSIRICLTATA